MKDIKTKIKRARTLKALVALRGEVNGSVRLICLYAKRLEQLKHKREMQNV